VAEPAQPTPNAGAGVTPGELPPGPRMPKVLQTLGWWARPTAFLERCRRRYGRRFTIRFAGERPFVLISDPVELKQLFTAPPDVLHPGEGARILEPVVGPNSILLLDEDAHMSQKRLLMPAFHGERMQALSALVTEIARAEIERWPRGDAIPIHARAQSLTLEVILRAVFGLDAGSRLEQLRGALTEMLDFGLNPISLVPQAQRAPFGRGPWAGFVRARARADELIYAEIAERRREGAAGGDDVLAALLAATHDDETPMSDEEIHDELLTLLVAGHETTATSLSWALERIARHPEVLARLHQEVETGDSDEYLTATIREVLRRRPVLANAAPRTTKKACEVGGITYPVDVHLIASAWLVHHDPAVYPDPYSFRPERFLDVDPGTYTWIPFGGGRRRCIGANFALMEMSIVLKELLRATEVEAFGAAFEPARRRAITVAPARGAVTTLKPTRAEAAPSGAAVGGA
jgi:cytochrome P450